MQPKDFGEFSEVDKAILRHAKNPVEYYLAASKLTVIDALNRGSSATNGSQVETDSLPESQKNTRQGPIPRP